MIIPELILAALLLALLMGGSIARLEHEELRGSSLLLLLLPLQMLWPRISEALGAACPLSLGIWVSMMGALLIILLSNVRRRVILAVAALGIVANMLVIVANGAMPVSIRAASEIGGTRYQARLKLQRSCLHEELDANSRLTPLADIIAIPGPEWHRGVVSVGDILLAAGLGGWVFVAARGRRE